MATRAYPTRRTAEGKPKKETIRRLNRYIAHELFKTLTSKKTTSKKTTSNDHPPTA